MLTRRGFIGTAAVGFAAGGMSMTAAEPVDPARLERIRGLMYGTMIGDALGGPIEFQSPEKVAGLERAPKRWKRGEKLDDAAVAATKERLRWQWRDYTALRPEPEPYAHWSRKAPPGTITDDSRHKLVLLESLGAMERDGGMEVEDLARAYLDWPRRAEVRAGEGRARLLQDWLGEWEYAARWVLGERDLARARPPERMWNGLATCCGQMTSLPLACVFAGAPGPAYEAAYRLGFFDNGWGRDLNAGIVAGLARALTVRVGRSPLDAWKEVLAAMVETDPYGYRSIPWCPRAVDRWMGVARRRVSAARGEPALLFEGLEEEFRETVKWEAQVPFVVVLACWEIAGGDPLVALALTLEWGHDTDSYAQIAGGFAGALYGTGIFPETWRRDVAARLAADYGVGLEAEVLRLGRLHGLARSRPVVRGIPVLP